eukprot:CAMPEP_0184398140 /NCGR_PEP_ID=MMETSP0007-20130409/64248_1 /TAXON_ID=97485 /ORGANISM="Prymnesium parvum, Strain Texoma1" /LENGTH=83 /DNA_ID=CAMNT_0026751927 /DNA_START=39 /DNA_END=288 /DNA_ORIENTATION=+
MTLFWLIYTIKKEARRKSNEDASEAAGQVSLKPAARLMNNACKPPSGTSSTAPRRSTRAPGPPRVARRGALPAERAHLSVAAG